MDELEGKLLHRGINDPMVFDKNFPVKDDEIMGLRMKDTSKLTVGDSSNNVAAPVNLNNPLRNLLERDETPLDSDINSKNIQTEGLFTFFEGVIYAGKSKISICCNSEDTISDNLPFSELKKCTKFPAIIKEIFEQKFDGLNFCEISCLIFKIILQNDAENGLDFLIRFDNLINDQNPAELGSTDTPKLKYYSIDLIYERFQFKKSLVFTVKDSTEMAIMSEQIRAQNEKDSILAHCVHDMRAPLNAIMGYSELLIGDFDKNSVVTENVEIIKGNAIHLSQLIGDFLDGVKMKNNVMKINPTAFDLNKL